MAEKDDSPESLLKLAQDRSIQGRRSLAAAMSDLFAERGWEDIVTYRDDLRHERVVHARWRGRRATDN